MKTIPILFTFDQSLEVVAGVCIYSLISNANKDTYYDIYILHNSSCDFSSSRLNELPQIWQNCSITFRIVEGEFVGGYQIRGIPETAYYRLIAPELFPEYDKILYSDVDVIFREDISYIYNIELGSNYYGAVETGTKFLPGTQEYINNVLALDWKNGYYYSGNLLINLKLLREEKLCEVFRTLGKNKFKYQDMDIINIACNGKFFSIGPSFCLTSYLYQLINQYPKEMIAIYGEKEIEHALKSGLVHYNGTKPWNGLCPNMDIWWSYYRKSIFFDEQFCHDFWIEQRDSLARMPMLKRIKQVLRYPLDRKSW